MHDRPLKTAPCPACDAPITWGWRAPHACVPLDGAVTSLWRHDRAELRGQLLHIQTCGEPRVLERVCRLSGASWPDLDAHTPRVVPHAKKHCKSCEREVFWIRGPDGRPLPLDWSVSVVWDLEGELRTGHRSHWLTCPDALDWQTGTRARAVGGGR